MDMFTALNNGSLGYAEAALTDPVILALGASVFDATPGSVERRLAAALSAMVAAAKRPVRQIVFDAPLESCTLAELRRIADEHGVSLGGVRRRADVIRALYSAQRRRTELS